MLRAAKMSSKLKKALLGKVSGGGTGATWGFDEDAEYDDDSDEYEYNDEGSVTFDKYSVYCSCTSHFLGGYW